MTTIHRAHHQNPLPGNALRTLFLSMVAIAVLILFLATQTAAIWSILLLTLLGVSVIAFIALYWSCLQEADHCLKTAELFSWSKVIVLFLQSVILITVSLVVMATYLYLSHNYLIAGWKAEWGVAISAVLALGVMILSGDIVLVFIPRLIALNKRLRTQAPR